MKRTMAIALLCGIVSALLSALYLNSLETNYRKGAQKEAVLTAKRYIDQGATISPDLLEERSIPKEYIQPRAVQSFKEISDKEGRPIYIAVVPVERGEQMLITKLSMLGVDTGISSVIPTGKRAVTLSFDADEVLGLIKPGNRTDLIGIFSYRDNRGQEQEESVQILQNVLVLSVGKSILGSAAESRKDANAAAATSEAKLPVSFAVSPDEAQALTLASEKSRIRLSLRPVGDDSISDTGSMKLSGMLKDIGSVSGAGTNVNNEVTDEYIRDIQKKQKEAMEILRKYQKR